MPDLLIRDLKPSTHELLRRRAETFGRSLQAEVHMILDSAARAAMLRQLERLRPALRADLFKSVVEGSPEKSPPKTA